MLPDEQYGSIFTGDGTRLITQKSGSQIFVWPLDVGQLLELAKARTSSELASAEHELARTNSIRDLSNAEQRRYLTGNAEYLIAGGQLDLARQLAAKGDYSSAIAELNSAIKPLDEFATSLPRQNACSEMLADIYRELAVIYSIASDPLVQSGAKAIAASEAAIELTGDKPENWSTLALAQALGGHPEEAIQSIQIAIRMRGSNSTDYFVWSICLHQLGQHVEAKRQFELGALWMSHIDQIGCSTFNWAQQWFVPSQQSIRIGNAALALIGHPWMPDIVSEASRLSGEHGQCGVAWYGTEQYDKGLRLAQRGINLWEQLPDRDPDVPHYTSSLDVACSNTALFLVTCPDQTYRDPEHAYRLAQRAVERNAASAWNWTVLGLSAYRTERWEKAIEACRKAEELAPGVDTAFNGFFIAMSYQQLGSKETAKEWYERSIEWYGISKRTPDHIYFLKDFKEEAKHLLEVATDSEETK